MRREPTDAGPRPTSPSDRPSEVEDASALAPLSLRVLLLSEGTYPYYFGGVSTWCDMLIRNLPWVDFHLVSVVSDPRTEPVFTLPANVRTFQPVPLWGTRELWETRYDLGPFATGRLRRRTDETTVAAEFVPLLDRFLRAILADRTDLMELAHDVHAIHRYLLEHDLDRTLRSRAVWDRYLEVVWERYPMEAQRHGYPEAPLSLAEATTGFQWLYRWFFPLARPLPEVDVVHAAMAGICTLPAVASKLEDGSGYLLTEHGIHLRERYLAVSESDDSLFLKLLDLRFSRRMTELSYAMADTIAPCCDYNQRWERRSGARPDQLRTIYYGLDAGEFQPRAAPVEDHAVVVWVGRINPLKDLDTLLVAAARVHERRPEVEFRLFGSAQPGDEAYHKHCLQRRAELGLEQAVRFMGYTDAPEAAFNQADVVVMSSISEGFPFSILEAMTCGRPIVATAVGGIPEQIAGCGIAVPARDGNALGDALLELIDDPERRRALGAAARTRALDEFGIAGCASTHYAEYVRLARWRDDLEDVLAGRPSPWRALEPGAQELARRVANTRLPHTSGLIAMQASDGAVTRGRAGPPQETLEASNAQVASSAVTEFAPPALTELVEEVARRIPRPCEDLEVAAVLESMGISDTIAADRHGAPDVFALAEKVAAMLPRPHPIEGTVPRAPAAAEHEGVLRLVWRTFVLASPGLMLLALLGLVAITSGWGTPRITVFGLGVTGGVLVAGALVQGANRRASIHLGLDDVVSARRFLRGSLPLVWVVTIAFGWGGAAVAVRSDVLAPDDGVLFVLAFTAVSAVWVGATALSLQQRTGWLGVGLGAAVAVIAVGSTADDGDGTAFVVACVAAFVVCGAIVALAVRRALPVRTPHRAVLPPVPAMVREALPFAAYGGLHSVLFFTPYVIILVVVSGSGDRSALLGDLGLGSLLALLPLLVAGGVAERALRRYWSSCERLQDVTDGRNPQTFSTTVRAGFRRSLHRYLTVVVTVGATTALMLLTALHLPAANLPSPSEHLILAFVTGTVGYAALGWGQFNAMFLLSLARPGRAVAAAFLGSTTVVVVAVPLLWEGLPLAALIAFPLGATVFAARSRRAVERLLERADHTYVSAV